MTETHRHSACSTRHPSGLAALVCVMLALGLSGCSSRINPVNWITPYRTDIIQGNFVSKEQVETLKAGMTRAQVKEVMGTPLLSSLFHQDRWDYVFTLKRTGLDPQSFKYTLFFKDDQLQRFAGDTMPSEAEFIATLATARKFGKPPVLEATEAQLKSAEKSSRAKATAADVRQTPVDVPAPITVYPPLEGVKR